MAGGETTTSESVLVDVALAKGGRGSVEKLG
jgi:hypothetical protein